MVQSKPVSQFKAHTVTGDNTMARNTWTSLKARGVRAKLLVVARHGQGHHNVAEARYGTQLWEQYWALKTGDDNSSWEDSYLTTKGIAEVQHTGRTQLAELVNACGYPHAFYCSPLRRCMQTLLQSWAQTDSDTIHEKDHTLDVHVIECIRETLGRHTCDRRVSHSKVIDEFGHVTPLPQSNHSKQRVIHWVYEDSMSEHDELWKSNHRETDSEIDTRITYAMDRILGGKEDYVSVTCHSGVMASILRVLSYPQLKKKPPTGSCLFVVAVENLS